MQYLTNIYVDTILLYPDYGNITDWLMTLGLDRQNTSPLQKRPITFANLPTICKPDLSIVNLIYQYVNELSL
jgi:hypothetical protein